MMNKSTTLDLALNITSSLCSSYSRRSINSTLSSIYNPDLFSDPRQLAEIACESARLSSLYTWEILTKLKIYTYQSIFGMFNAFSAILVYSFLRGFQKVPAFNYYRAVSFFDFFYAAYLIKLGFFYFNKTGSAILEEIVGFVGPTAAKTAHLMVLWTAMDRALACHAKTNYKKLDSRRMTYLIIFTVFMIAVFYEAVVTGFSIRAQYYGIAAPTVALAVFDRIWRAGEGLVMLACTCLVLKGLRDMTARKKRLINSELTSMTQGQGNNGPVSKQWTNQQKSTVNRELLNQIKINTSLCVLQLCEAVPFILVTLFDYASYLTDFFGTTNQNPSLSVPYVSGGAGTFGDNVRHQKLYEIQCYMQIALSLCDFLSHACHFLFYLAFSPRFRGNIVDFVRRKGNGVNGGSVMSMSGVGQVGGGS